MLALYALGVVLAALVGGAVPLLGLASARRLERFLAASAGVMLGVLATHLLPEAFEAGPAAAWSLVAGFVFMLLVERFILPHAFHAPQVADEHEHCAPDVEREHVQHDAAGVGAFVGLALHTLGDGLALGASSADAAVAPWVFLAIAAHKIPSAFALASILVRARARPAKVLGASTALGAMVGVGALFYLGAGALFAFDAASVTPWAVGFSAGSFLHVVVTDLVPDLHRHGHDRRAVVGWFLGGLALMVLVTRFLPD
ncbi:MAG: hypothetical protein RL199_1806 [Pseudomonadota bacterium]|jgi:zinc and cadmium transporter